MKNTVRWFTYEIYTKILNFLVKKEKKYMPDSAKLQSTSKNITDAFPLVSRWFDLTGPLASFLIQEEPERIFNSLQKKHIVP